MSRERCADPRLIDPQAPSDVRERRDRCSPASTGMRSTTRDASPSRRASARSSPGASSSRGGSTPASRSFRWRPGTSWRRRSASLPMTDPNARLLQRQLFAGAFETELDRQGRVLVPGDLRELRRPRARGARPRLPRPRRDLGARPLGRPTARALEDRAPSPTRSPAWGSDVAPHALPGSARDPQPTDGGVMEEGHLPVCRTRSSGPWPRRPAASRSTPRSAAVGTPSGSWRPPAPTAASWGWTPTRPRSTGSPIRLARFGDRLVLRRSNFRELAEVAPAAGFGAVDGMLFDLGLSLVPARRPRARLRLPDRRPARHALRHDAAASRPRSCSRPCRPTSSRRCSASTARSRPRGGSPRRSSRPGHRSRSRPPRSSPSLVERSIPVNPRQQPPHPPRDARVPGAPDRGQRGARRARGRAGRGDGPAAAGRPPRRPLLPLARGPDRQAVHQRRAAGLHLPARGPGLRLRPRAAPPPRDRPT